MFVDELFDLEQKDVGGGLKAEAVVVGDACDEGPSKREDCSAQRGGGDGVEVAGYVSDFRTRSS